MARWPVGAWVLVNRMFGAHIKGYGVVSDLRRRCDQPARTYSDTRFVRVFLAAIAGSHIPLENMGYCAAVHKYVEIAAKDGRLTPQEAEAALWLGYTNKCGALVGLLRDKMGIYPQPRNKLFYAWYESLPLGEEETWAFMQEWRSIWMAPEMLSRCSNIRPGPQLVLRAYDAGLVRPGEVRIDCAILYAALIVRRYDVIRALMIASLRLDNDANELRRMFVARCSLNRVAMHAPAIAWKIWPYLPQHATEAICYHPQWKQTRARYCFR